MDELTQACSLMDNLIAKRHLLTAVKSENFELFPNDILSLMPADKTSHGNALKEYAARERFEMENLQSELEFIQQSDDREIDDKLLVELREISSTLNRHLAKFVDVYDNELAIWTKNTNAEKIEFGLGPRVREAHIRICQLHETLNNMEEIRKTHNDIMYDAPGCSRNVQYSEQNTDEMNSNTQLSNDAIVKLELVDAILRDGLLRRKRGVANKSINTATSL
ncbi:3592_t:CDS:2 [Paraglomus brasilianum]|uniref:3592_t:CDS:1 n=1 Tax=Paraglomus brasilianum TaxID=144538 RepID=A0A9N9F5L7_9GLOM|nr:3592_t:CDS:2 [Paraglomus brasilianum]